MPRLICLLLLTTFMLSCEKDEEENSLADPNTLKVEIDGSEWEAPLSSVSETNGVIQVQSFRNSDSSLVEIFFTTQTFGSYPLPSQQNIQLSYSKGDLSWSTPIDGSVNILTNQEGNYVGSFRCRLRSDQSTSIKNLRNGSFNYEGP